MAVPSFQTHTVSVILTVYNRTKFLNRCIDSLLIQSFKNWELIAVDDGSTDNSFDVLKSYENKYKNIKVIRQENMKLPLSRNNGIKAARGKYITFLDSDDEYEREHLLLRVNFMGNHKNVDLIHGGVNIIGDQYVRDKDEPHKFVHLSKCAIGATFFGKREVFLALDGFKNITYSEDSEFLQRAVKQFNVQKVNYNTYIYHRESPNSLTHKYAP